MIQDAGCQTISNSGFSYLFIKYKLGPLPAFSGKLGNSFNAFKMTKLSTSQDWEEDYHGEKFLGSMGGSARTGK